MFQRLRIFVFWLLLFALPLQSFAAVTGGACTCMHVPTLGAAASPAGHDQHGASQRGDEAEDHATAEKPCHSEVQAPQPHCDSGSAHSSEKSSCGACSGCCMVHAAIPAALFAPEDVSAPRISAVALPDLFTDHITPTPKRPPRFFSA